MPNEKERDTEMENENEIRQPQKGEISIDDPEVQEGLEDEIDDDERDDEDEGDAEEEDIVQA